MNCLKTALAKGLRKPPVAEFNMNEHKPKRTVRQQILWWWNTRIKSLWTVKLAAKMNAHGGTEIGFTTAAPELPDPSDNGITAILTVYKRGQYVRAQIEALRNQSVPPDEIWVWTNQADVALEDYSDLADRVVVSNSNWKFWGRFALANMVRTRYVCLLDDDILPQPNWFKNCINTIDAGHNGILGGSGVLLPAEGGYSSKHKVGWNGHHHNSVTEVDLVGHAWFFNKQLLHYMWIEQPHSWENGEDIHFSAMALKHGGIKTFVPPHPETDASVWSCRPDFGKAVGRTSTATYKAGGHHTVRDNVVDAARAGGWKIVADRNS